MLWWFHALIRGARVRVSTREWKPPGSLLPPGQPSGLTKNGLAPPARPQAPRRPRGPRMLPTARAQRLPACSGGRAVQHPSHTNFYARSRCRRGQCKQFAEIRSALAVFQPERRSQPACRPFGTDVQQSRILTRTGPGLRLAWPDDTSRPGPSQSRSWLIALQAAGRESESKST